MEYYLDDYIEFLSGYKKDITILVTREYISKNSFDVKEILKPFQEYIDFDKFCALPDSKEFYRGHRKNDKYEILIHFFSILHGYSKNLLLNYDIYSKKTIQKTNSNIQECLIYIPNFQVVLSELLGYYYDDDENEWCIKESKLTNKKKKTLSRICLLCGYAHEMLTKMQENQEDPDDFPDDNLSILESEQDTVNETVAEEWTCKSCTYKNTYSDSFCKICLSAVDQMQMKAVNPNKRSHENIHKEERQSQHELNEFPSSPVLEKKTKFNERKCETCAGTIEDPDLSCKACSKSKTVQPLSDIFHEGPRVSNYSSIKDLRNKEILHDLPKYKRSQSSLENAQMESTPSKNIKVCGWTCQACSFANTDDQTNCVTCFQNRLNMSSDIHSKETKKDVDNSIHSSSSVEDNITKPRRADSSDENLHESHKLDPNKIKSWIQTKSKDEDNNRMLCSNHENNGDSHKPHSIVQTSRRFEHSTGSTEPSPDKISREAQTGQQRQLPHKTDSQPKKTTNKNPQQSEFLSFNSKNHGHIADLNKSMPVRSTKLERNIQPSPNPKPIERSQGNEKEHGHVPQQSQPRTPELNGPKPKAGHKNGPTLDAVNNETPWKRQTNQIQKASPNNELRKSIKNCESEKAGASSAPVVNRNESIIPPKKGELEKIGASPSKNTTYKSGSPSSRKHKNNQPSSWNCPKCGEKQVKDYTHKGKRKKKCQKCSNRSSRWIFFCGLFGRHKKKTVQ